jgi:hypothetical protein
MDMPTRALRDIATGRIVAVGVAAGMEPGPGQEIAEVEAGTQPSRPAGERTRIDAVKAKLATLGIEPADLRAALQEG